MAPRSSVLWGPLLSEFCDSKSNKIGISFHPEVLPFLNLWSAALNLCASPQCYRGDPRFPPQRCSGHRGGTVDLVCPDAKHAAAARGASCELATNIWAEKEDSSGAAGLLLWDRSLLSRPCPPCHLMVQDSIVQYCKLLSAPLAPSDPQ